MAFSMNVGDSSFVLGLVIRLALFASVLYLANRIIETIIFTHRTHHRYNDIPQTQRHWLWGHIISIGPRLSPSVNQHPDYTFQEVWEEIGQPPAFVLDMSPIDRATLVICDPSMAEMVTQPSHEFKYSTPKSNTLAAMTKLVGDHSLVILEGDEWRTQRRRFNKGFAPAHLNTLVPFVVNKTRIFLDRLKAYAKDGNDFVLKDTTTDLTMDVITQVAIEKDFQAQTTPVGQGPKSTFGILTAITIMSSLTEKVGQGFELAAYLQPQKRIKEWIFDRIYTRAIYNEIVSKLPTINKSKGGDNPDGTASARAVVQLALTGVEPTQSVIDSTISQVKTFLFAGQDTTSTLIQWMAYELSKSYPSSPFYSEHYRQIRERLCIEHDEVFGYKDPFTALDVLDEEDVNVDEMLGIKLPYTTAFIKETLRLHPPAASARLVPMHPYDPTYPKNKTQKPYFINMPAWTHCRTGQHHEARQVRIDGMRIYVIHHLIQRNPAIWGPDAFEFNPARFLDRSGKGSVDELEEAMNTTTTVTSNQIPNGTTKPSMKPTHGDLPHPYHISILPQGSYRPFERGPRTCIGSNLAYMEAKIVLSIIARGFEWQKVGLDGKKPKPGEVKYFGTGKEDEKVGKQRGWEVWCINNVTSVPVDGMKMRIKLRS